MWQFDIKKKYKVLSIESSKQKISWNAINRKRDIFNIILINSNSEQPWTSVYKVEESMRKNEKEIDVDKLDFIKYVKKI